MLPMIIGLEGSSPAVRAPVIRSSRLRRSSSDFATGSNGTSTLAGLVRLKLAPWTTQLGLPLAEAAKMTDMTRRSRAGEHETKLTAAG